MPSINQSQRDALGLQSYGEHVAKASATLPATTTQNLFTITGGRVLITLLFGEVTTVVQAQANNLKVTSAPTTGSAVDIASNVDINGAEAGCLLTVEGDLTALVKTNAGAGALVSQTGSWVCPIGTIRIATSATSTGGTKWDLFYVPIDDGALIVSA